MKHTPGPWKLKPNYDNMLNANFEKDGIYGTIRGNDWNIARMWTSSPCHKEDTQLIAAAPDLLEALKELQKQIHAHMKMDVKKHFSLLVADAAASKVIHNAEGK